MTYAVIHAPYFDRKVKRITKRNIQLLDEIKNSLETLEINPKRYSRRLTHKLKGKRRIHVGSTEYRIIYTICEECRELNELRLNRCSKCKERDDLTVILRNFDHRKKIYKQKIPPF